MSKYFERCKTYKAKLIQEEFDERFETHIEKSKCKINTQMLPGWGDEKAVFQYSDEN